MYNRYYHIYKENLVFEKYAIYNWLANDVTSFLNHQIPLIYGTLSSLFNVISKLYKYQHYTNENLFKVVINFSKLKSVTEFNIYWGVMTIDKMILKYL